MKPQFIINRPTSMSDEDISISLVDVPPSSLIKIQAQSSDYYGINAFPDVNIGSLWSSNSIFKSSDSGSINLKKDPSLSGSYIGTHGMGLLYTMKPVIKVSKKKSSNLFNIPVYKNYHIKLSAYKNKQLLCEAVIVRNYQNNNILHQDIYGENFVARFFQNKELKNQPAIIVLSGSDGRIEKAQSIAQSMASHGFSALAVCYFGLKSTSTSLSNIPLEIIEESISFLKQQDNVNPEKIALYGRSKGGELALLAGSIFTDIHCVVANTPSSFIFEGLNEKNRNSKNSTWSYRNHELPYIPFTIVDFIPYILKKFLCKKDDLAKVYQRLLNREAANNAKIAVEKINGSVLLISSQNDEIWPSTLLCNKAIEQFEKNNFSFIYEHEVYKNSGHNLTIAYQPNPRYSQKNCLKRLDDEKDSWMKTIAFLKSWSE